MCFRPLLFYRQSSGLSCRPGWVTPEEANAGECSLLKQASKLFLMPLPQLHPQLQLQVQLQLQLQLLLISYTMYLKLSPCSASNAAAFTSPSSAEITRARCCKAAPVPPPPAPGPPPATPFPRAAREPSKPRAGAGGRPKTAWRFVALSPRRQPVLRIQQCRPFESQLCGSRELFTTVLPSVFAQPAVFADAKKSYVHTNRLRLLYHHLLLALRTNRAVLCGRHDTAPYVLARCTASATRHAQSICCRVSRASIRCVGHQYRLVGPSTELASVLCWAYIGIGIGIDRGEKKNIPVRGFTASAAAAD